MGGPWDKYAQPASGPWAKYAQVAGPEQKTGAGESLLEHSGDAMALGYLPQLQAMAEPITDRLFSPLAGKMDDGQIETQPPAVSSKFKPAPLGQAASGLGIDYGDESFKTKKDYLKARDLNSSRLKTESSEHPYVSTAGDIGGGIVSALATPIPGGGPTKGLIDATTKGIAYGGLQGLIQNPGDAAGEFNPFQGKERLGNMQTGAIYGGVAGAVTHGVGGLLKSGARSGDIAEEVANDQAVKATGANTRDFRSLEGRNQTQMHGEFLRDQGLVKAGDTIHDVAEKSEALNKNAGERLDNIYERANKGFGDNTNIPGEVPGYKANTMKSENIISPNEKQYYEGGENKTPLQSREEQLIGGPKKTMPNLDNTSVINDKADEIVKLPRGGRSEMPGFNPAADKADLLANVKKEMGSSVKAKAALRTVGNYLDDLVEEHGNKNLDPKTANTIKTAIDKEINYARDPLKKEPELEKAWSAARDYVASKVKGGVSAAGGEALVSELEGANKDYGQSKRAANTAGDAIAREKANRVVSLSDYIAGGAGSAAGTGAVMMTGDHDPRDAGVGAAAGAIAAGAVNHYGRKYGPGLISGAAGAAEPILRKTVEPVSRGLLSLPVTQQAATRALIERGLLKKKQENAKR